MDESFEEMLEESLPRSKAGILHKKYDGIPESSTRTPRVGDYSLHTKKWMKNRSQRRKARKRQRQSRRKNRGR